MPIIGGGGIIGGGSGGASPDTTTFERIPYKDGVGVFANSPLYFDTSEDKVVCDVTFEVPSGTLAIGETTNLSAGGTLILSNEINDTNTYTISSEWDSTGSSEPVYLDLDPESILDIQLDFSQTITANPLTWSITGTVILPKKRQVNAFRIKTGAAMTNVRLRLVDNITGIPVRYIPSKADWNASTGLSLIPGDNELNFVSTAPSTPGQYNIGVNPYIIENGQQIDIELRADTVSILGDALGEPYQQADIQDYLETSMIINPAGIDRAIQYNNAGVFGGEGNFIYTRPSDVPILTLESNSLTGGAEIKFNDSTTATKVSFRFFEAENNFILNTATDIESFLFFGDNLNVNVVGDYTITFQNDEAVFLINDFAGGYAFSFSNALANTLPLLVLTKTGPQGGTSQIFTSTVSPEGAISGNGGDLCIVDAGVNSDFFLKRSDGGNTGWVDFLHSTSGVKGPATSTDNAIATWNGVDGSAINDSYASVVSDANTTHLYVNSVSASGQSLLTLRNNASANRFSINYNQALNDVFISSSSTVPIFVNSGNRLLLEANERIDIEALGDYAITIDNDEATFSISTSTNDYYFSFSNTLDGTVPLMNFAKAGLNGGSSKWFFSTVSPETVITGNGGDLCIVNAGVNSNIYLKLQNATNTNWQSLLGDVIGPATSTDSAVALFDGTTGKLLKSSSLVTVSEATQTELRLKSPSATLGSQIVFESFGGGNLTLFQYDENALETSLILTGTLHSFNLETTGFIDFRAIDDDDIRLRNDSSSYTIYGSTQSYLHQITNNQPNTNALIRFSQTGVNGGSSDIHFSTVAPEGVISGVGGALCLVKAGINSDLYIKRTDTGNTGWADFLHGASGVQGPAVSVDNAIATWDGTDGLTLNNTTVYVDSDVNSTFLYVDNITASGQSSINLRTNAGASRFIARYNQTLNDVFLISTTGVDFFVTSGGRLDLGGAGVVVLNTTTNNTVTIANNDATFLVNDSAGNYTFDFSNSAIGTNPLLSFRKTGLFGGTSRLFVTSTSPLGSISANGGDLAIIDAGILSNLYLKRVDGGTGGWNVCITSATESSTLNAIPSFDVTTGNSLTPINTATLQADTTSTFIDLRPVTSAGNAEINYRTTGGALKAQLYYDEDVDTYNIETDTAALNFGNFGGPLRFTSISADSDLYIRNATPVGIVTGNPGDLSIVASGTSSGIYVHEGSAANNTDWYKVITKGNDTSLASIFRLDGDGNSPPRTLSAIPVQIIDFTTDGDDNGLLTSDQANNEIVIDSVVDTVNGDLYEISVTMSVQCSNTNREVILQIYYSNGVTDVATNIRTRSFFDSANEFYSKKISGPARGPSTITGTGAFKVFFSSTDTGSLIFRELIFTAKRLL